MQENRRILTQYEAENGVNGSVPAHLTCYMAGQEESKGWSHIILDDHSRIFLTPKARCTHPVGTRLQIVYTESDSRAAIRASCRMIAMASCGFMRTICSSRSAEMTKTRTSSSATAVAE